MPNKTQYYRSNTGLGYAEYNFFVKINKDQLICVGHTLEENEPSIELGQIVNLTGRWEDLEKDNFIMREEVQPCNYANVLLNKNLIDMIVKQNETIIQLKQEVDRLQSQINPLR